MAKYIDANEFLKYEIKRNGCVPLIDGGGYNLDRLDDEVNNFPAADVQEIRHGKWIYDKDYDWFHCSECQCVAPSVNTFKEQFDYDWDENLISSGYEEYTSYIQTNYCPECGAKMDGKEDENDR